jgi:hypothetical protein
LNVDSGNTDESKSAALPVGACELPHATATELQRATAKTAVACFNLALDMAAPLGQVVLTDRTVSLI